jgi:hypothetical protein
LYQILGKTVLERGIDNWLERVESIADIWKEVSKGAKLPNVLKIRLRDNVTNRPGYFYLFDLFNPSFLPLTPDNENSQHIYFSFEKLS